MHRPISPEEKIAITLRFLATGETFHSLIYQFRVHRVSMGKFVPEVCKAIYHCVKDGYLKIFSTTEEWDSIAEETNSFTTMKGFIASLF